MTRTALVLGASGLVGGHLLELLLDDDAWHRVIAPGRRPLDTEHAKLEAPVVDFERLGDHRDLFAVDDVFCCLGTTIKKAGSQDAFRQVDFVYPFEAARLAAEHNAKQYLLVSAIGARRTAHSFYSRVKGEIEDAIARLPFESYHVLRPSLLLGDRDEVRVAERLAIGFSQALLFLMIGPLQRYRPIHARQVAQALVNIAQAESAGHHVYPSDRLRTLARTQHRPARSLGPPTSL